MQKQAGKLLHNLWESSMSNPEPVVGTIPKGLKLDTSIQYTQISNEYTKGSNYNKT